MNFTTSENILGNATTTDVVAPLQLVSGTFKPEEARDILLTLVDDKISFHRKRNFSSTERFGVEDPISKKRLPELLEMRAVLAQVIKQAAQENKVLVVDSKIYITLEENPAVMEEPTEVKYAANVEDKLLPLY
jgi:hypothetical protein